MRKKLSVLLSAVLCIGLLAGCEGEYHHNYKNECKDLLEIHRITSHFFSEDSSLKLTESWIIPQLLPTLYYSFSRLSTKSLKKVLRGFEILVFFCFFPKRLRPLEPSTKALREAVFVLNCFFLLFFIKILYHN